MSFVEDVDFEAVAGGAVARSLAEFADFVDAAVGGGVDFDDIDRVSGADFGAGFADAAGLGNGMILGAAIQAAARMRATVVLPMPRCPLKM